MQIMTEEFDFHSTGSIFCKTSNPKWYHVLNMDLCFENPFSLVKLAPLKNLLLNANYFCICFSVNVNSLRTAVY